VSRDVIYREAWGDEPRAGDRSVDVLMVKLRGLLAAAAPQWTFIDTHHRRGYSLAPRVESRPRRGNEPDRAAVSGDPVLRGEDVAGCPLVVGPVEIIPDDLLVIVDGDKCWLRPRDMDVLVLLASQAGRVISREMIFETIWKKPLEPQDRSVDVSIRRLRARLVEAAPRLEILHTHHGRGYRFEPMRRRSRSRGRPDKLR